MDEIIKFDYPDQNLYILGAFFGIEREKKGYSLRGIARSTNITPTLISDIENQKVKPNLETLIALYESLDISFITNNQHLNAVSENITAFYHAIYEMNDALSKSLKDSLEPQIKILKTSLLGVDILLAEAMITVEINHLKPSDAFYSLENQTMYLNDYQRQKYYLIKGQYLLQSGLIDQAKEAFEEAVKIPYQKRGFAAAHDYLAYIESVRFLPFKAIEHAKIASKSHGKYSNLYRKIQSDFILIKSYIELYQLKKAEDLIYNLSFVLVESNQRYYLELQAFKAYLSYVKKEYHQAIEFISVMTEPNIFQRFLIIMAFIKTNQLSQASDLIKQSLNKYQKEDNEMALSLIKISSTVFNDDIEIIPAIDYFIQHFETYLHIQVIKEMIQLSSTYLYQKEDLNRIYQLQQLSQKIMNFGL